MKTLVGWKISRKWKMYLHGRFNILSEDAHAPSCLPLMAIMAVESLPTSYNRWIVELLLCLSSYKEQGIYSGKGVLRKSSICDCSVRLPWKLLKPLAKFCQIWKIFKNKPAFCKPVKSGGEIGEGEPQGCPSGRGRAGGQCMGDAPFSIICWGAATSRQVFWQEKSSTIFYSWKPNSELIWKDAQQPATQWKDLLN